MSSGFHFIKFNASKMYSTKIGSKKDPALGADCRAYGLVNYNGSGIVFQKFYCITNHFVGIIIVIAGRDHGGAPALCEDRLQAAAGVRGVQGGGVPPVGHVAAWEQGHAGEDSHLQHGAWPGHQVCPDH